MGTTAALSPKPEGPQRRLLAGLSRPTPSSLLGLGVFCIILIFLFGRSLTDPDVWWHLKTGEIIIESRSIPTEDPYSFTAAGKAWVAHEWGSEVLMRQLVSAFGLRALIIWRAVMLTLTFAVIAQILIKESGNRKLTWGILFLTAFAGAGNFTERPNLFSFLLFAFVLRLILKRDRSIWWLVPITLVWANLHGMFLLGLGLVFLAATAEALKLILRWDGSDPAWTKRLWVVAALSLIASFINPYGPALHPYLLRLVKVASPVIQEWSSPDFHSIDPAFFLLLTLMALAGIAFSPKRADPTDVALVFSFLTLGLFAWRNLTVAAIIMGVMSARYLPPALATIGRSPGAARKQVGIGTAAVLNVAVILGLTGTLVHYISTGFPKSNALTDIVTTLPAKSIQALPDNKVRLFTELHWGGLALYSRWPHLQVQIDGRVDMYGSKLLTRDLQILEGQRFWKSWMAENCVTHALIDDKQGLAVALRQDSSWQLINEEDLERDITAVLYKNLELPPSCARPSRPAASFIGT